MYLKSVTGKILYEGRFTSLRQGVEMAIEDQCDLRGIDLRQANLSGAFLDGAKMEEASFWGANLTEVDMSDGIFCGSDFRAANLLGTCMAAADLKKARFEGAYFSRTILRGSDLQNCRFSCPSIFTVDLGEVKSLNGAIYSHLGEVDCDLSQAPIIIRGLKKPLILMEDSTLVGGDLKKIALRQVMAKKIMEQVGTQKLLFK